MMPGQSRSCGEESVVPMPMNPEDVEGQQLHYSQEDFFELAAQVFGNDLILDIIISHAIAETNDVLDTATVCALRTLGKTWDDSICKLLHHDKNITIPLFRIQIGHQIHLNGNAYQCKAAEFLAKFTKTFQSSSRVLRRPPTYQLCFYEAAFQEKNYESLYNFLIGCGEGLVSTQFNFPSNGGSMNGTFPNLALPSLKDAHFELHDGHQKRRGGRDNIKSFLQSIISAATTLDMLKLLIKEYKPSVFEGIMLPPTITNVSLNEEIGRRDVEILLIGNALPMLNKLDLAIDDSIAKELLLQIFEKFRKTLRSLILHGDRVSEDPVSLQLPIMEKLTDFVAYDPSFIPESTRSSPLERFLPKLRELHFFDHTEDMITAWTNGSKLYSVQELEIENFKEDSVNFNTELAGQISLAFPNLTNLYLSFREVSSCALQIIFMEIGTLVDLGLSRVSSDEDPDPTDWDSALIGKTTQELKAALELKEEVQLDEETSIRKLKNLRILSLTDDAIEETLVIDVIFRLAFFKMPNLQELTFGEAFSVSPEIAEKWRMDGRRLNFV